MNKVNLCFDSIKNHKDLFNLGKKCLIVTGKNSAQKCGAYDDVIEVLNELQIEHVLFDGIQQNPTVASCIEAAKLGYDCDFVIGIGGGSPLDATKAIAIFCSNQDLDEDKFYQKAWTNKPLDFILIGTSAGTGSEVTQVSVLTDKKAKKHSIHDEALYAKYAFGDYRYTLSLKDDFVISTGIDALSHCVESYFSNKATTESKTHALKGINLLFTPLIKLVNKEELTLSDKEDLYKGSIEGGYAIDISGTCFPHNVGYYLTENYHIPHGFACVYFLNDMLEFVEKTNLDYFNDFLNRTSIKKEELYSISKLLPEYNIELTEEKIDSILPRWENNGSVKNTYGSFTVKELKEVLITHLKK